MKYYIRRNKQDVTGVLVRYDAKLTDCLITGIMWYCDENCLFKVMIDLCLIY